MTMIVSDTGLLQTILPLLKLLLEERALEKGTTTEAQLPLLLHELANLA